MAQKKGPKDPFSEFIRVFEQQRKEMEKLAKPFLEYPKRMEKVVKPFLDYQQRTEKMAKPILEYQRKLFEQSKKFHEALTQNVVETIGEVINQMIEEQRKQTEEANKLLSEMSLPKQVTEYLQNLHKIQERWIEQLKKGTEMIEGFVRSR
ncbi:MAG: hypothetical protein XU11_C0022G0024 [Candidatus Dadabacteria bacterium CSP1-2]|nr:MAG: hypothetical protein XU11_C0022G0024 [Candidatus Dadabacteria bacterium CSP1-2]OGE22734.1 MAG: hypothetical protein A2V51_02165 [Candidatus Dadabacteria bacterium RBG_19FT_COMBO_40_33]